MNFSKKVYFALDGSWILQKGSVWTESFNKLVLYYSQVKKLSPIFITSQHFNPWLGRGEGDAPPQVFWELLEKNRTPPFLGGSKKARDKKKLLNQKKTFYKSSTKFCKLGDNLFYFDEISKMLIIVPNTFCRFSEKKWKNPSTPKNIFFFKKTFQASYFHLFRWFGTIFNMG